MKKRYLLTSFILFFIFLTGVSAEAKTGFVNCTTDNSPLNVRPTIGSSASLKGLTCNSSVTIMDENAGSTTSCNKWYKIKYDDNKEGYVCGNYIAFDYIETETKVENLGEYGFVSCKDNNDPLYIRSSISSYDVVASLSCDTEMKVISKSAGSNNRCSNWYKVSSGGNTGYACGEFIYGLYQKTSTTSSDLSVNAINNYKNYLRSLGFPDSYLDSLVELHKKHPTWQFRAFKTRLNWESVISNQMVQGRNLIYYTYDEGYRSTASYSYNWQTDTYYRHPTEKNWWYVSDSAVRYYMDPRNFLTEDNLFMYEVLSYQSTYQNAPLIRSILDSGFMPSIYSNFYGNANKYNYSNDFILAASTYNISPVHLAARIIQEGNSQSSVSYNNVNYKAYNFFNIKAYGENPAYQGLLWAASVGPHSGGTSYGRAWDTPKKSILGGAQFLSEDYISIGQDTLYFQKFAVSVENGLHTHQYMQNITAPLTEGRKVYNTYAKTSAFEENLVFVLPVYESMPTTASPIPKSGNPNYYLNSLNYTLDGKKINVSNFNYQTKEYSISVPTGTTSITLGGSTISSKATTSGFGTFSITGTKTLRDIIVTAGNGNKLTYKITITKEDDPEIDLETILNSSGIKYNDNYISGIKPGTNVDSLIKNIKAISSYANIIITDSKGNTKTNTTFKTGDKVKISSSSEEKEFEVVIYGDINGDGEIDKLDYLAVLRHFYGYVKYEGVYKEAADAKRDGVIDKLDYLAVLRDHYNYAEIIQ